MHMPIQWTCSKDVQAYINIETGKSIPAAHEEYKRASWPRLLNFFLSEGEPSVNENHLEHGDDTDAYIFSW